jgi:hypothetical protein
VRAVARTFALVHPRTQASMRALELACELFGDVVDECLSVWCVATPYSMFTHKLFQAEGDALVSVRSRWGAVAPLVCSTLSMRSMSFVRGGSFSVTKTKGKRAFIAYGRAVESAAMRMARANRLVMVLKLISWKQSHKVECTA